MFDGIPVEAFRFYEELEANNTREWWNEQGNGMTYRDVVRPAMEGMLDELDLRWMPMTIYRPHRNVRFSSDKTPYKKACGAAGAEETGVMHYVQIGASWVMGDGGGSGLRTSRGMYRFSSDQLLRYFDAVHEDDDNVLTRAMASLTEQGYAVGGAQRLTTAPRGFSREHRRVELLRLSGISVSRTWSFDDPAVRGAGVVDLVQRNWEAAAPVTDWLAEHVGPPEL